VHAGLLPHEVYVSWERSPSPAIIWSTRPNARPLTGIVRGLARRRSYQNHSTARVLLRVSLVQRINIHGAINLEPELQRKYSGDACQMAGNPPETRQVSVKWSLYGMSWPTWAVATAFNSVIPRGVCPVRQVSAMLDLRTKQTLRPCAVPLTSEANFNSPSSKIPHHVVSLFKAQARDSDIALQM
jgi:hypothetical protein